MSYIPTINVKKETAEVKFYFPIIKDGKEDVQILSALFEYILNGNNGKYWYCTRDWRD